MAKINKTMIQDFSFYRQNAQQIMVSFTPRDLELLVEVEKDYSPTLHYQLLRLLDDFENLEEYLYCAVLHNFMNKQ